MRHQDTWQIATILCVVCVIVFFSEAVNGKQCSENACRGKGACSAGACTCVDGYAGPHCQYKIVNCTNGTACMNQGFCIHTSNTSPNKNTTSSLSVKCQCPSQFYGESCQYAKQCLNNPCVNGKCQEDYTNIYRYKCICHDGYVGKNCGWHGSVELEMEPKQGPMAGGTLVMFKGNQSLIGPVTNITIDGVGSFTILQNTSDEKILAKSPSYPNGNDTKIEVIVEIELNGGVITRNFTYKPNPTISNIFPRSLIQSARTSVTVIGTDLDAVGDPRLIITAVKRKMKNKTKQFKSKTCTASEKGDSLKCKAPKIPPKKSITFNNEGRRKRSFEHEDTKVNILKRAVSRLRRQEPDGDQDDIDFIFGLQLDGVEDYTDLTQNLPNLAYVDVDPDPTFDDGQIFYVMDGGESQIIGIKGENVDSGVVEDFTVLIGNASCSNIGLTNDKLYCYPPTNLLELGDNVRSNNEADATVKVGETLSYNVGYVVYEKEETVSLMKVFVPVVAAIGGALLIVIIILIICACRKRRTKTEQKQRILPPPSATDIHNMTPGGNDNYYTGTDQSAAPNPYYMVVNDERKE